jgi:alkanesulfonate monooxygenase SsuD/methylene tetrahydromethanopterin reductase-like flavin-dependent oxidoreductase (luciferase family)
MRLGLHFSCSAVDGTPWADIYEAAIEQAVAAEQLGFDCALVSEHHFKLDGWIPSPLVLCGAIAARTTRIGVGTDIVILPFQHPIRITEDILVLDNLSRGRAICGVGMGDSEAEFLAYGVPYKQRVSRSEEALVILRRLMSETEVSHEGRYYRFSNVTATPRPVRRPAPPIWYGAISEAGARRAARLGDGLVMGPTLDLAKLLSLRAAYHDELRALGRDPEAAPIILRREAYVAEDSVTAWREVLAPLKHQYSRIYTNFPGDGTDDDFRRYARDRFIIGGPEEALADARRFRDAVHADVLLLRLQLPGLDDRRVLNATRIVGERLVPEL